MATSGPLSEERENLLIKKKPELLSTIRLTPMLWASLCKYDVITVREIGEIQRNGTATPQTQINDLVDHIRRDTNQRYSGFLRALAEAGQEHVVIQQLQEIDTETSPATSVQGHPCSTEGARQIASSKGPEASPLPPWDKNNTEELTTYESSQYHDVLNMCRVSLLEHLQDEAIWPHLRTLGVINRVDEEHLTYNKSRPDRVARLLNFIETGPRWHFHSLLRAMAQTAQADLIPTGGVDKAVYTQGCDSVHQGGRLLKILSKDTLRVIRDHCKSYQTSLMRRHIFDFDGDSGEDVIDISSCIINVDPFMKHGSQVQSIPTSQILEQLDDEVPPRVIRIYGDPGDGKTSLMRHIAYHWSTHFPELLENDQYLTCQPLPWTTLVYLEAQKITTTVEDAIRDALGCKVQDTEIHMDHIRTGDRVGVLMDSIDELRDQAAIKELKRYIHERKMKGGPTVLISARTDICPIDAQDIDRFLTLQGFSEEEGIDYVKKYTKMHHRPDHALNHYVVQHQRELQPVLTNPLRLYLFSALALRDKIKLEDDGEFNIPKLFQPLERYLLRRSGTKVTEQQSSDFYRMCLWGLLKGVREFSAAVLEHFDISPAYHVFLQRSDRRRSEDGELVPYYTFSHEMVWEFFAASYINTLSTKHAESFLVSLCKDEYLRNLQKLAFQLLLQDWSANCQLLQTMIRCIFALQDTPFWVAQKVSHLCGFVSKNEHSDSSLVDMLYSTQQEFSTTEASSVCKQINDAFDKHAEVLRENAVFHNMKDNGTIHHVVDCLQTCSIRQRKELLQKTTSCLLPCKHNELRFHYLQTGATQWGEVDEEGDHLIEKTCTPVDGGELLTQYVRTYHSTTTSHPTWRKASVWLHHQYYTLWGAPPDCRWCKDEWHTLFYKLIQLQVKILYLYVCDFNTRIPLTGMLTYMAHNAAALNKMEIHVYRGRIELSDLVTLLPACHQAGLDLSLRKTQVVVPSNMEESTLRVHREALCDLKCGYGRMLHNPSLQTEGGQEFVW